jgi:hypothetical protein
MTYDTILTDDERDALASELESADWHSAADDIRDGITPEAILSRLRGVASAEDNVDETAKIIDRYISKARKRHTAEDPNHAVRHRRRPQSRGDDPRGDKGLPR